MPEPRPTTPHTSDDDNGGGGGRHRPPPPGQPRSGARAPNARDEAPRNDRLLRALRLEPVDRTPVWFMRQAGRSLPRYREQRRDEEMFDLLRDPEAAAEITALPLDYYPTDALVLYSDLSVPFIGAGLDVEMVRGSGPVVEPAFSTAADLARLRPFDPRRELDFTLEAIRLLARRAELPIIGFVGGPFTLCSYLMPPPRARRIDAAKRLMWTDPSTWDRLLGFWSEHLAEYALAQHEAGATVIQVFDSWAGALSPDAYREHVFPHSRSLLERLEAAGVPTIHFFTGNPALLPVVAEAGGNAIGIDWRIGVDAARDTLRDSLDHPCAIQGNLDPAALLAGEEIAVRGARDVLRRAAGRPGHIFNLGHGVLPETDPAVLRAVVEAVHAYGTGDGLGTDDRVAAGD